MAKNEKIEIKAGAGFPAGGNNITPKPQPQEEKVVIKSEEEIVEERPIVPQPQAQPQKENPSPLRDAANLLKGGNTNMFKVEGEYSKLIKKDEFTALELSATKRDLVKYVNDSVALQSDAQYTQATIQDFNYFINNNQSSLKLGNGLDANEANQLLKLYYPSSKGNVQSVNGVFELIVNRSDLLPADTLNRGGDLLELSTLEDVSGIFQNSKVSKFTLEGYRNLYSINTATGKVNIYLPAVLVLLSYFGFEPKDTIRDYYVAVAETTNSLTIRIRK